MTDPIPDYSNRLAYGLSYLFHPFVVSIATLFVVLNDLPLRQAIAWVSALSVILIGPVFLLIQIGNRQQRYVHQRLNRTHIYIVAWVSILINIALIWFGEGPQNLLACFVALAIWVPIQFSINTFHTKISGHAAVIAACTLGLYLLGHVNTPFLQILAVSIMLLTAWARYTTLNHTLTQLALGIVVGAASVVMGFALTL